MTDTKKGGGPAFPVSSANVAHPKDGGPSQGMSLRDYFAGQVLSSYAMNRITDGSPPNAIAADCYLIADAMIAEGDKTND